MNKTEKEKVLNSWLSLNKYINEYSESDLKLLLKHEQDNNNRSTLVRRIKQRLNNVSTIKARRYET